MTDVAKVLSLKSNEEPQSREEAIKRIDWLIKQTLDTGKDHSWVCDLHASKWGVDRGAIKQRCADMKAAWQANEVAKREEAEATQAEVATLLLVPVPVPEEEGHDGESPRSAADLLAELGLSPKAEEPEEFEEIEFEEPDEVPAPAPARRPVVNVSLPTKDAQEKEFARLAELYDSDPIEYSRQLKAYAARLCTDTRTAERVVRTYRAVTPKVEDEPELSQASKVVAIGIKHALWRSPEGEAYATVAVDEHRENYRVNSKGYEQWLRHEYAERHKIKIGDEWLSQVPGNGALRDGMSTLASQAMYGSKIFSPATRVGWALNAIWIDLGDPEWRAIRVTADGWEVVAQAEVPFVRSPSTLALPLPVRGGSVSELRPLLNVAEDEFVLVAGWLVQALNPQGSYPILGISAESEMGKTTVSTLILRMVDPSSKGLRHKPKNIEDLLVVAKNNWTTGFDNLSSITAEMSDTLCMLCTGIATGKRANYTDDEEAGFKVKRPLLFNGIPTELGNRSDLLSRMIRLKLPRIDDAVRRFDEDIDEEFASVWPRVLGALLDGVAAGLRGKREVQIERRARLADFEAFAEAACRGMGFRSDDFVEAYRANRDDQMRANVDQSAVGRMLRLMMETRRGLGPFAGKMSALLAALPRPDNPYQLRFWPADATRLSTELRRLHRPLEAIGIRIEFEVDRRGSGGSQQDVVVAWVK